MAEYKTKAQKKKFYNSAVWSGVNGIRIQALKRDNYECQECKQQGRVSINDGRPLEVDHIKPIETYPELANELSNTRTLCHTCHDKKHNRFQPQENKWNDEKW